MLEIKNFYILQHGICFSRMPAWKQVLSEQEIWEATTFLGHMNKLPPQISDSWKAAAGGFELVA
jgi:hypothetical protein